MDNRTESVNPEDLRREIELLKGRLAELEQSVQELRMGRSSPLSSTGTTASAAAPPPIPASSLPPTPPPKVVPLRGQQSLERRIGSQLFNRVGIVAVLFAMGWFLKLAIDRNWIGPATRVSIGLLLAIGLVFWSERFRLRGFTAFSYSLKALGTGIAYLSLWAAFALYSIMPGSVAFLCMVAVTAANAALAWVQDSELLGGYALLGGNVTPVLLSTGENHEIFLFSYLFVLNSAAVFFLLRKNWSRLVMLALASTTLYFFAWAAKFYQPAAFGITVFYLALFFLLFAAVPLIVLPRLQSRAATGWLRLWPAVVSVVAWFECLSLSLSAEHTSHQQAALSLALGVASLGFALVPQVEKPLGGIFSDTHLLLVTGMVAMAILLGWENHWIAIGWLAEGIALAWLASFFQRNSLLYGAQAVLLLAFGGLLLLEASDPLPQPVAVLKNAHFGTYLIALIVYATAVALALRESKGMFKKDLWQVLAGAATIAFNVVAILAVSLEIHHYWSCGDRGFGNLCANVGLLDLVYARFSLSAWLMIYGAVLMATGFLARQSFLRWQALVLLLFSVGKVFLYDASKLSQVYRVLSFLVLGVLLLAISYAYQRDLLSLRTSAKEQ